MLANRLTRNLSRLLSIGTLIVLLILGAGLAAQGLRTHEAEARLASECDAVNSTEDKVRDARKDAAIGKIALAVLGDSYAQGMHLDNPMDAYPYRLHAGGSVLVDGSGGSGYTAPGPCGPRQVVNRLNRVLAGRPPVLIVQAGLNDVGSDDERVAVADVIRRVKAESPKTKLVLVGPFAPPSQVGDKLTAIRDAIRDEAAAKNVMFVDPSGWQFDLLPDGLHPSVAGHEEIAARLLAEIGPLLR